MRPTVPSPLSLPRRGCAHARGKKNGFKDAVRRLLSRKRGHRPSPRYVRVRQQHGACTLHMQGPQAALVPHHEP